MCCLARFLPIELALLLFAFLLIFEAGLRLVCPPQWGRRNGRWRGFKISMSIPVGKAVGPGLNGQDLKYMSYIEFWCSMSAGIDVPVQAERRSESRSHSCQYSRRVNRRDPACQ